MEQIDNLGGHIEIRNFEGLKLKIGFPIHHKWNQHPQIM